MSWSNVIKRGEDVRFTIRSFDPDAFQPDEEDEAPRASIAETLVLPGGPAAGQPRENGEDAESAEERLARLEREAYEKGFEQGRKDGLELEKKQIEEQRQQMEALFGELRSLKAPLLRQAEQEAVLLSTRIARRIVREEIRSDPSVIQRTVRAALDLVADRSRLALTVHPEDMEEIRKILPELSTVTGDGRLQVTEDDAVDRGGCVLETGFGRINATVSDQLSVIDKTIEKAFAAAGEDGA